MEKWMRKKRELLNLNCITFYIIFMLSTHFLSWASTEAPENGEPLPKTASIPKHHILTLTQMHSETSVVESVGYPFFLVKLLHCEWICLFLVPFVQNRAAVSAAQRTVALQSLLSPVNVFALQQGHAAQKSKQADAHIRSELSLSHSSGCAVCFWFDYF